MNIALTPNKEGTKGSATKPASYNSPRAFAGETLANSLLLKALAAGWLTQQDIATVIPMLAFQHEVAIRVVRCFVDKGLVVEGSGSLDTLEYQRLQYEKALRAVGAARLIEEALPGFAKHFSQQSEALIRQSADHAAVSMCGVHELIQTQVLAEMVRGLEKAFLPDLEMVAHDAEPHRVQVTFNDYTEAVVAQHLEFLAELHAFMRFSRMRGISDTIQARISLERNEEPPIAMFPGIGEIMCEERDDKRGIEFSVERYPCTAEVLDPRVVRIPPGKTNNRHKHAHETLFYFIEGHGEILVGEKWVPVKPGDAVFSPRWAIHQTRNTGSTLLTLLAITDYYLTSQVYVGKYDNI